MKYKVDNVKNYSHLNGWLCGQFFPDDSIQKNDELEVNYRIFRPGDTVEKHYHPVGKEIIVITSGRMKMNINEKEHIVGEGDFIYSNDSNKEEIVEVYELTTVISIRTPSVPNNKIIIKNQSN